VSFRTVLFDLDGTLTDSGPGITASVGYALAELGLPPLSDAALNSFVGPPLIDSFRDVAGLDPATAARAVATYRERYGELGRFDNAVYPGIPELLDRLVADGRRLAVATSKLTSSAVAICDHFGLSHYFEVICGSDLEGLRHTKADVVVAVLAAMVVSPGPGVVLIGDRSYDVVGARATGIACIGAGWGYGSPAELSEAGADTIAATVDELAGLLGLTTDAGLAGEEARA
jgi:phosphoglycolate phosphatase